MKNDDFFTNLWAMTDAIKHGKMPSRLKGQPPKRAMKSDDFFSQLWAMTNEIKQGKIPPYFENPSHGKSEAVPVPQIATSPETGGKTYRFPAVGYFDHSASNPIIRLQYGQGDSSATVTTKQELPQPQMPTALPSYRNQESRLEALWQDWAKEQEAAYSKPPPRARTLTAAEGLAAALASMLSPQAGAGMVEGLNQAYGQETEQRRQNHASESQRHLARSQALAQRAEYETQALGRQIDSDRYNHTEATREYWERIRQIQEQERTKKEDEELAHRRASDDRREKREAALFDLSFRGKYSSDQMAELKKLPREQRWAYATNRMGIADPAEVKRVLDLVDEPFSNFSQKPSGPSGPKSKARLDAESTFYLIQLEHMQRSYTERLRDGASQTELKRMENAYVERLGQLEAIRNQIKQLDAKGNAKKEPAKPQRRSGEIRSRHSGVRSAPPSNAPQPSRKKHVDRTIPSNPKQRGMFNPNLPPPNDFSQATPQELRDMAQRAKDRGAPEHKVNQRLERELRKYIA